MASVYSDSYWTGSYTYTRVRVDYSGTSASAHLLYTRTNTYSGETSTSGSTFTFGGASTSFSAVKYGQMTDVEIASVNFTISTSGGSYSGSTGSNAGYFAFSGSVSIPAQSTSPSGSSILGYTSTQNSITASVKLAHWGNASSGHYQNLFVTTANGDRSNYRANYVYTTSYSLDITVNNSNSGNITISPNSKYYLANHACTANGCSSYVWYGPVYTAPAAASSQSVTYTANTATVTTTIPADGGALTRTLTVTCNGTSYTHTESAGSASTFSTTFSGLSANTVYTATSTVSTSVGTSSAVSSTFSTEPGAVNFISLYGYTSGNEKAIFYVKQQNTNTSNTLYIKYSLQGGAYNTVTGNLINIAAGGSYNSTTTLSRTLEPDTTYRASFWLYNAGTGSAGETKTITFTTPRETGLRVGNSNGKASKYTSDLYIGDNNNITRCVRRLYVGDSNGKAKLIHKESTNRIHVVFDASGAATLRNKWTTPILYSLDGGDWHSLEGSSMVGLSVNEGSGLTIKEGITNVTFRKWASPDSALIKSVACHITKMPTMDKFTLDTAGTTAGDYFFASWNDGGSITSLPAGSFDTSGITTTKICFFRWFNYSGKLTSLPVGSLNTSNITSYGDKFLYGLNNNGNLIKSTTDYTPTVNITDSSIVVYYSGTGGESVAAGGQFYFAAI